MTGNFLEAIKSVTSFQAPYCRDLRRHGTSLNSLQPYGSSLKWREEHLLYIPFGVVTK